MPMPDACLFDLDGLLLDTEPLHAQAWREAAGQFGITLSAPDLLQLRGRRRLDCVAMVREWIALRTGRPAPSEDALLAVQQPVARRLMPAAQPMAGARALVASCQEWGVPMALVTSSTREAVELKCAPHGWLATIRVRVLGDFPTAEEDVVIPLIETLELIQEPDGSPTEDFIIPTGFQTRQKARQQGR